jgi:hypothetical protein
MASYPPPSSNTIFNPSDFQVSSSTTTGTIDFDQLDNTYLKINAQSNNTLLETNALSIITQNITIPSIKNKLLKTNNDGLIIESENAIDTSNLVNNTALIYSSNTIVSSTVTANELLTLKNIESNIQTQLDSRVLNSTYNNQVSVLQSDINNRVLTSTYDANNTNLQNQLNSKANQSDLNQTNSNLQTTNSNLNQTNTNLNQTNTNLSNLSNRVNDTESEIQNLQNEKLDSSIFNNFSSIFEYDQQTNKTYIARNTTSDIYIGNPQNGSVSQNIYIGSELDNIIIGSNSILSESITNVDVENKNITLNKNSVSNAFGSGILVETNQNIVNSLTVNNSGRWELFQNNQTIDIQQAIENVSSNSQITVTGNRAVVSNSNGNLIASNTTANQIGFLSNLTSDVQDQLNSKSPNITFNYQEEDSYFELWANISGGTNNSIIRVQKSVFFPESSFSFPPTSRAVKIYVDNLGAVVSQKLDRQFNQTQNNRILITDNSGVITVTNSSITTSELSTLIGINTNQTVENRLQSQQTQINNRLESVSFNYNTSSSPITLNSNLLYSNLTQSSVILNVDTSLSNSTNPIANAAVNNAINNINNQITNINTNKQDKTVNQSNRVLVSNSSSQISTSNILTSELNQLQNINTDENIQSQINKKLDIWLQQTSGLETPLSNRQVNRGMFVTNSSGFFQMVLSKSVWTGGIMPVVLLTYTNNSNRCVVYIESTSEDSTSYTYNIRSTTTGGSTLSLQVFFIII